MAKVPEAIAKKYYDVVVVGAGIVGCAVGRQVKIVKPELKVAIIDKEDHVAAHQSGHNSGVLHAGIYYQPGSLKAKLCVKGIDLAYDYLEKKNIPHKRVGKLIVAVDEQQVVKLQALYERATQNKCKQIELIDSHKIKEIEPNVVGLKAIWSPYTGIVDWGKVTKSYADDFINSGGYLLLKHGLQKISYTPNSDYPVCISTLGTEGEIYAKYLITCAGLQSDRVAMLSGCSSTPRILPFRGEYLKLKKEKSNLVKTNIYPVPDPRFPFLGVHFTPNMNGDILLGPNAVLAFSREGYKYTNISASDLFDALSYRGMQRLIFKYATFGMGEMYRSLIPSAQVKLLQKFVPSLRPEDVESGVAGVRAQALDENGNLVDDFVFDSGVGHLQYRVIHVRNSPSPAATSSLAIAEMIVDEARRKFNF